MPLAYYAGAYRQEDPNRVCLGQDVGVGNLAGEHYRRVPFAIGELQKHLQAGLRELELRWEGLKPEDRLRSLCILIGTAIGAFIKIHPFLNGNGRMSRMLWSVLLARFGVSHEFSVLKRPPGPRYADAMKEAMAGDYSLCVLLVLEGLARQPAPALPVP